MEQQQRIDWRKGSDADAPEHLQQPALSGEQNTYGGSRVECSGHHCNSERCKHSQVRRPLPISRIIVLVINLEIQTEGT